MNLDMLNEQQREAVLHAVGQYLWQYRSLNLLHLACRGYAAALCHSTDGKANTQ